MGQAALIIGTSSTIYSATRERKARKQDLKAQRLRQKQGEVSRRRERQMALASAAKQRASIRAQATSQLGVGSTSSAVEQASGSITSQLSANLGFATQLQALEDQRTRALEHSARATGQAAIGRVVGQLATSAPESLPTTT